MKAVRYRNASGEFRIGRLEDDQIVDAGPAGEQGFVPTRAAWAALAAADGPAHGSRLGDARRIPSSRASSSASASTTATTPRSRSSTLPEVPVIFAKWTTSLIGHGETIVIPREETRPDYEGELAVVIGEPVYRATGAAARAAVGAYTCFHDVSGRRAQLETPLRQFTYGKSFDTFGPLGPCLVDADGVDLGALDIETVVSGETLQSSNTSNLIFGIAGARRVRLARAPRSSRAT